MDKMNLIENTKDGRFYLIQNKITNEIVGFKCTFCEYYNRGKKPGGSFYKHIRNCALNSNFEYDVQREDRELFAKLQLELMAIDFDSPHCLCSPAKKELYQFLINYGHSAAIKAPKCPPPKIEQLLFDRTVLFRKLENAISNDFPEIKQKIQKLVKNNSGCVIIDMIGKSKHYFGIVLHVFDDNWNLKVLPLDIQLFEEDATGENVYNKTKEVLNEYGIEIEDVSYKTGEETNMLLNFNNVEKTSCVSHFLKNIINGLLIFDEESDDSQTVDKNIKDLMDIIEKIKEIVSLLNFRTNLQSQLNLKLINDMENDGLSKFHLAKQFLNLTTNDLEILKSSDEPLPNIIQFLLQNKEKIMDFVNFISKFEEILLILQESEKPTIHLIKPLFVQLEKQLKEWSNNGSEIYKSLSKSALLFWNLKIDEFSDEIYDISCFLNPNQLPNLSNYFDDDILQKMKNYSFADDQVLRYFQEDVPKINDESFNLNEWWKKYELLHQIIGKLAKKILAIPATTSSMENLISYLNSMKPYERNKMKDVTISNLVKYKTMGQFQ
uniref:HAT C-terminal dimerisation domain-containing protein n=1 Tax=Panagrolaimus sp. JU765 TaxID=591449 RepID=A0AC34QUS0_9BILA